MRVKRRRLKGFLKEPYPEECLKLDGANLCITKMPGMTQDYYNFELTKCIKYGKYKKYRPRKPEGVVHPFTGYKPEVHGREYIGSKGERYHVPECRLFSDGEWYPQHDAIHVNWYKIEGTPSRWRRKGIGSKTYKLFEKYWKNRGVKDVQLRSLMEADGFWRKMGFHALACEKSRFTDDTPMIGACRVGHPKDEYYRRGRWAGYPRRKESATAEATDKMKFLCGYKHEILGQKRGPDQRRIIYVADKAAPNKPCVGPSVEPPHRYPSWEEPPKIHSSWLEQFKEYHRT